MNSDDTSPEENVRILRSLWEPHSGQRAVMNLDVRFRIVAAGRRWGKSVMAAHEALARALEENGSTVWWVSPSYDQSNDFGFDKIKPLVAPDVLADVKRTKPRALEFDNGSRISFRSAEREDSLRGPGLDFLVIDEAGSVPARAWNEELRPALSDTRGDALMIGTPKGRNFFFDWYSEVKAPTARIRRAFARRPRKIRTFQLRRLSRFGIKCRNEPFDRNTSPSLSTTAAGFSTVFATLSPTIHSRSRRRTPRIRSRSVSTLPDMKIIR